MSVKSRQSTPVIPPLKVHKASGQAYANVRGSRLYLGKADTPEARRRYALLVAQLAVSGGELPVPKEEITVAEVLA